LEKLKESERILDVLRPISPAPRKLDQATIENFMKVLADINSGAGYEYGDDGQSMLAIDPNTFFSQRFSNQIKSWGPVFFGSQEFMNGRTTFVAESINDLAFAAILGGDPRLGQQVVYHPSEAQWYFYDYRVDAYSPTTDEKMALLASNWLIRCSQVCQPLSARAVLKLRTPQTIKNVITTAKAMLEVEKSFFTGKDGHRRYVDGKFIEPTEEPSYQVFVKKAIIAEPQGKVTVHDAFHRYYQFCRDNQMTPLTRQEFKSLVSEVIRAIFNVGLRHDIIGDNNKQGHGWCGITYRQEFAECLGRN
jgi:hypothetical protein